MKRAVVTVSVLLALAILAWAEIPEGGQCIWYGIGPQNPQKGEGVMLNKAYSGPAKLLDDFMAVVNLKKHCPSLVEEIMSQYDGKLVTCCDADNISNMTEQFGLLDGFLRKCPACQINIKNNFCYFTCHPRHSNFLIPTTILPYDGDEKAVWALDYYITDNYTNGTYDSCRNVYLAELNTPALTVLCGSAGLNCDPYKLFSFFGNNQQAPFNITYQWVNDTVIAVDAVDGSSRNMIPFDVTTIPCNTTDPAIHCLCSDCRESCTALPDLMPDLYWPMVGSIDAFAFTLILVYLLMTTAIIVNACVCWKRNEGGCCAEGCCTRTCSQSISAAVEKRIKKTFTSLGTVVAKNPFAFLLLGSTVIIALGVGVLFFEVTTDPVELWASPTSKTRKHKEYYDTHFQPFYRATQIIIVPKGYEGFNDTVVENEVDVTYQFGPALNESFVRRVFQLQNEITSLVGDFDGKSVALTDVCMQPLAPQQSDCLIQSVPNYWQNDQEKLEETINNGLYTTILTTCFKNPTYFSDNPGDPLFYCLGSYGGPVFPYTALGGFMKEGEKVSVAPSYTEANALIINILLANHADKALLGPVLAWEKRFIEFMKNVTEDEKWTVHMDIAFNAERGIEDELERESVNDIATILISYLIMFAYITIALGNTSAGCSRLLIESKILLAFGGVLIVMLAVVSSLGFYGYVGVPATLFVIEVIPFLVLAVGVDNIFIIVQTWQREPRKQNETVEEHIGRVVGIVAPSMLLATTAEALCFLLGGLSDMPAVHAFAVYAGLALIIDFFLQMTCFVALLSLDARRVESNRWDVLCCIKGSKKNTNKNNSDVCHVAIDDFYAPFILSDIMRVIICILFSGVTLTALAFIPHIEIGLDQSLAMPEDSFVLKYFQYLNKYLSVGPPVYFVVKEGYNFTDFDEQDMVCQESGCNDDSIMQKLFLASLEPEKSYIASGAMSWLEQYFTWLIDGVPYLHSFACCRLYGNGTYIDSSEPIEDDAKSTCFGNDDFVDGRPKPHLFMRHLRDFLSDNPHGVKSCPSAGHPAYGDAVNILTKDGEDIAVGSVYYMAYHSILKTSEDFIKALDYSYRLSELMTSYLQENSKFSKDIEVFPYSIFYVYYEQYLTIWEDTAISMAISLGSVFAVALLVTFNFLSSVIILVTICMIIIDMMGFMVWWNISLNAVSLVNLVMTVGISVEFCGHVTHAFATSMKPTRAERAHEALVTMGTSVLSGITLTKFAGIFVLGFAQSQIFKVFYFRMYLGMVIFGASHGLMFLPVFLSLCGPSRNLSLPTPGRREEKELGQLEAKIAGNQEMSMHTAESNLNYTGQQQKQHQTVTHQTNQQHEAFQKKEHEATNQQMQNQPAPHRPPSPYQASAYEGTTNKGYCKE